MLEPDVPVTVRAMRPADWPAVATVYAEGIATGDATFETEVPAWERPGQLHGRWRDVVLLERRSATAGD